MLVEAGANLNVIDANTEDTPLYVATREGNYKMVKYLLSRDTIDINQRCGNNRYHRTSLFLSILPSETRQGRNRNRIFNLFIEHPNINVNLLDTRNGSPLFYACKKYLSIDSKAQFTNLFKKAGLSLDKMKETYHGSEAVFTIDQLQNILHDIS